MCFIAFQFLPCGRFNYLKTGRSRFRTDGLNGLKYKLRWVQEKKLYTWLMVEIVEKDVLSMYALPESKPLLPLDQAEGHGNEARRRMKEQEEWAAFQDARRFPSDLRGNSEHSPFDADTYPDEGEDIKGGLTILSAEDVRNAKAKLKSQIQKKMEQMKHEKLKKAKLEEQGPELLQER